MEIRERLLAAHLFYDFSWAEWIALGPLEDFSKLPFRSFPGTKCPKTWTEALLISAEHRFRRLSRYDADFPQALVERGLDIPVIYIAGRASIPPSASLIAVVGTRATTSLGERSAYQFSQYFCAQGMGIVSGLARGIDGRAHQAALDSDGFTIAVLGTPLDNIYPKEHQYLAAEILAKNGLLLSEFPPGTSVQQYFFPRRNTLLAALTAGVLVVEAPPKSGAQITAKYALANGLPVCVPPRDYCNPIGQGALALIQIGAWPIGSPAEALESFSREGKLIPLEKPGWQGRPKGKRAHFSLEDFCQSYQYTLPEGIAQLQLLLQSGALVEVGPNRYHLPKFAHRKNTSP